MSDIDFPLRHDLDVTIINLPRNLTIQEVERFEIFLRALVVPAAELGCERGEMPTNNTAASEGAGT